eukprot:975245-Amphidinium_carterae.1
MSSARSQGIPFHAFSALMGFLLVYNTKAMIAATLITISSEPSEPISTVTDVSDSNSEIESKIYEDIPVKPLQCDPGPAGVSTHNDNAMNDANEAPVLVHYRPGKNQCKSTSNNYKMQLQFS